MPPHQYLNLIHNTSIYPTPNPHPTLYQTQYARMFSLIDKYISTSISAEETVPLLLGPINQACRLYPYHLGGYRISAPDCTEPDEYCETLFRIILDLAVQIPHSHPYQDRLVRLLEVIKMSRGVTVSWGCLRGTKLWDELPMFQDRIRYAWTRGPYEGFGDGKQFSWIKHWTRDEFANLNAFAARLIARRVWDMDSQAIHLFRDTLETASSVRVINDLLPSAAMYIRYAGPTIYMSRRWEAIDDGTPRFGAGELYEGLEGFCKRRWWFWKIGFLRVSWNKDLEEGTRDLATEVVRRMKKVEREEEDGKFEDGDDGDVDSFGRTRVLCPANEDCGSDAGSDRTQESCDMELSEGEYERSVVAGSR